MKKMNYETPEILLTEADENDVISTSGGDTPTVDIYGAGFEW